MSEEIIDASHVPTPAPPTDDGTPMIWLSFCPDLGLYHFRREAEGEEPSDTKFTRLELVDMVEGLMRAAKIQEADQLAKFCAWARLFGHKIVEFTDTGAFRIYNPALPDEGELAESEDMKKFFADWRAAHPDDASLPTMPERK